MNNEKILIKESINLHLSTQGGSSIPLNGSYRSKVQYDLRNYLNFSIDDTIKYVTFEMPYAILTNSNYIINEYNNKLYFTYAGSTSLTVIPEGNYSIKTFITYLQSSAIPTNYFIMTYSDITNKITITSTSTYQSLFPSSTWGFQQSTCDYIFGFTGVLTTTSNTLILPRSMNFLPIPRFLVHCNLLSNGLSLGNNSTIKSTDILASIPNIAKLNSQITYESDTQFFLKNLENNNVLEITITDDNNNEINFNGLAVYMTLKFNIFRYIQEKPEKFKNILEKNSYKKYENKNNIIYED